MGQNNEFQPNPDGPAEWDGNPKSDSWEELSKKFEAEDTPTYDTFGWLHAEHAHVHVSDNGLDSGESDITVDKDKLDIAVNEDNLDEIRELLNTNMWDQR